MNSGNRSVIQNRLKHFSDGFKRHHNLQRVLQLLPDAFLVITAAQDRSHQLLGAHLKMGTDWQQVMRIAVTSATAYVYRNGGEVENSYGSDARELRRERLAQILPTVRTQLLVDAVSLNAGLVTHELFRRAGHVFDLKDHSVPGPLLGERLLAHGTGVHFTDSGVGGT